MSNENAQPPAFPVLAERISLASISSETPESSKNIFFVAISNRLSPEVPNSSDLGIFTPISLIYRPCQVFIWSETKVLDLSYLVGNSPILGELR